MKAIMISSTLLLIGVLLWAQRNETYTKPVPNVYDQNCVTASVFTK